MLLNKLSVKFRIAHYFSIIFYSFTLKIYTALFLLKLIKSKHEWVKRRYMKDKSLSKMTLQDMKMIFKHLAGRKIFMSFGVS